jgi:hypothetical protein
MPIPGLSDIFSRRAKSGGRWINFVTVCAWCKRTLRRERVWRDDPDAPDETSHGICAACERKYFPPAGTNNG